MAATKKTPPRKKSPNRRRPAKRKPAPPAPSAEEQKEIEEIDALRMGKAMAELGKAKADLALLQERVTFATKVTEGLAEQLAEKYLEEGDVLLMVDHDNNRLVYRPAKK